MSSKVEEVARAIFETWAKEHDVSETWDEIVSIGHSYADLARREAREAIKAMREPTASMRASASRIPHARDDEIYTAMIDAALSEEGR